MLLDFGDIDVDDVDDVDDDDDAEDTVDDVDDDDCVRGMSNDVFVGARFDGSG